MISGFFMPKRRLSMVHLHTGQLWFLCGMFVLLALLIYAGLDYVLTPYYHQEVLREVRSGITPIESDVAAALIRQDFEAANVALDHLKLNRRTRSKQLHVFSPDNFKSYSLSSSCKHSALQTHSWGVACIDDGLITIEVPVWSADNLLGHIQLLLTDNIWSWAPLRYAQIALAAFIILIGGLCFVMTQFFRRQFGSKVKLFLRDLQNSDDPEKILLRIDELPLTELHELSSRLVDEMRKHARLREHEQRIEFQNRLLELGQQLDHAIKNRVSKVTDVLEAENLRRPARAAILAAFSECNGLIQEKLKRVEEYRKAETAAEHPALQLVTQQEHSYPKELSIIGTVVSEVLGSYRACFDAVGIDFRFSISAPAARAKVFLTPQELNHLLSNIIQNGIESLRDGSVDTKSIEMTVAVANGICEISLRDSGRGFSSEVVEKLKTNEVITTKIGGNGVGTKAVRDLVWSAGGKVRFANSTVGGAEVVVQIPTVQTFCSSESSLDISGASWSTTQLSSLMRNEAGYDTKDI